MYKRILIPVNFSDANKAAVAASIKLAKQNRSEVTLLHVVERLSVDDTEIQDFYRSLETKSQAKIAELATEFEQAGIKVESQVKIGRAANEIVRWALENEIDLVVLSVHQLELDQPMKGLAQTSFQVSLLVPCQVLLVKQS